MNEIKLFYPIKPIHVNQAFGQNINSSYLERGLKGHSGIDFRAYHGQKIYAAHDGVCRPMVDSHGGNGIIVATDKYETIYWHLIDDDAVVHTGQVVKAGDLLGYADNTGNSTGDHLHLGFSIFGMNNADNGYDGFIDPQPYFNGLYAEDINKPVLEPMKYVFTKLLKQGSWNMDVKQLQIILITLNLYTGVIDGIFGPKTLVAVKAYQTSKGLFADGIVGQKTRNMLNTL